MKGTRSAIVVRRASCMVVLVAASKISEYVGNRNCQTHGTIHATLTAKQFRNQPTMRKSKTPNRSSKGTIVLTSL